MEQTHNDSSYYQTCAFDTNRNTVRIVLFLLFLLIFVTGLLGNLVVLWVNWHRRRSANGVLFCVINVSLSDMMVITTLPFFMMEAAIGGVWLWGGFLCKVTNLVYAVNCYSSSFFLALMTLERYLSVSKPAFPSLFPVVGRRRWWLCGGVWLFSFFLALLENVHVKLKEWGEPGCFMLPDQNHLEWFATVSFINLIVQFLGPSAVIITCNVLIARAVRAVPDVQATPKDIWLVHVYSLVFVLCWLPYHLANIALNIESLTSRVVFSCNLARVLHFSYEIVQALSMFHCVANPILYNFLSKSFRNNLINKVVTYINKEGNTGQMETGTRPNVGGGTNRDASTSQSDADS